MVSLYISGIFMYNRIWENRNIYKREQLKSAFGAGFARE